MAITPPAAASAENPTGNLFIDLMVAGFNTSSPPPMGLAENKAPPAAAFPEKPTGYPFIDLLDAGFNDASRPPMGLTENSSPTFLSSGDPCLDFFFHVVPDTSAETINRLLTAAWDQDPLTALKLVCHLCGVRGTGKSDRSGFYNSALWLYKRHPVTLAVNAHRITGFGYLKNLPEILHRLIAGPNNRETISRTNHNGQRSGKDRRRQKSVTKEERLAAEIAKVKIQEEEVKCLRQQKRFMMVAKAAKCYDDDPNLCLLRDKTSDLFAALLSSDLEKLKLGDTEHLSLAAKWCPFPDSAYDCSTLLCEAIARRLFPRESHPNYMTIEESCYACLVCYRLHKEVLVPLRDALQLPEVNIKGKDEYPCVTSVAMMNYKKLFQKHDAKRFSEFLGEVKNGKAKIAAGALLPHQVLAAVRQADYDEVAELQWQRIVSDLSEKGKLSNCIAVCDVSSRMTGTQFEVCVALGLLISELSEVPWNGRLITFSEKPQVHKIKGETLKQKAEFIGKIKRGMNTNFQRVFDEVLRLAVERNLEAEKMVKRVFVFSDMEFDQASVNLLDTDYEVICRKFVESGYGSVVPEIVFWNLRDSRSTPVPSGQKGVALVSGFSKNLMKVFIECDGILSPKDVMEAAIAGEEYQKLQVFD